VSVFFGPICAGAHIRIDLASILFLVLPLLRPEIPVAIPLRPLDPCLNLLAAEESRLTRFVVRDAVEIQPAADELNLRVTRDHPPQFVDINPILLRAEGAVQDRLSLECKPLVDDLQLPDDSGENLRNHGHINLLHTGYLLRPPKGCVAT